MPVHLLKNKGQLQIGESIIVIILVMILAVFALIFTASQAKDKYHIKVDSYEEFNAVETAQIVTSLYELRCAKEGLQSTCVDFYKAQALADIVQTDDQARLYYYDLFRNAKITLSTVYPGEQKEFIIYEVNATEGMQEVKSVVIPVSIHDAGSNKIIFGILSIQRFYGGSSS